MPDTYTYSSGMRHAAAISQSSPSIAILMGTVNISSYSQTKTPLIQIVGQFDATAIPIVVQPDAVSTAGYHIRWDPATQSMRAYQSLTAAADTEVANATNVGTINFVAFGKAPR
jgi:hypothetical protein